VFYGNVTKVYGVGLVEKSVCDLMLSRMRSDSSIYHE